MGFDIFVQLQCPACGEVRDNPAAKHDPPVFRNLVNAVGVELCAKHGSAPPPADPPLYTTLASYLAALETHGATAGDLPMLITKLRATGAELDEHRAAVTALLQCIGRVPIGSKLPAGVGGEAVAMWVGELRFLAAKLGGAQ
ncbi:MAG: hypothetical protein V4479_07440 [Actinomycetota bacterium]